MKTRCPNCKQKYEIDNEFNNQNVECNQCKKEFIAKPLLTEQKDEFSTFLNRMTRMSKSAIQGSLACDGFKVPIIAQIIRGIGFLGALVTFLISLFAFTPSDYREMLAYRAFYVFLATVLAFALASIISYLARIEYNTRKK